MNDRTELAAQAWLHEFAEAFGRFTGQPCGINGNISEWAPFPESGGEWYVQRFSGATASAWLHVPDATLEIIRHYVEKARATDLFSAVTSAFADSKAIRALPPVSCAAPGATDGQGFLMELNVPSGSCSLGLVLDSEAAAFFTSREGERPHRSMAEMELMLDMELPITISIGSTSIPLRDVLKLTTGSIVELDRLISDPVDVLVSNRVIARGEVVVIEGNYGIRILEIVSRSERLALRTGSRRAFSATALAAQGRSLNGRNETSHE